MKHWHLHWLSATHPEGPSASADSFRSSGYRSKHRLIFAISIFVTIGTDRFRFHRVLVESCRLASPVPCPKLPCLRRALGPKSPHQGSSCTELSWELPVMICRGLRGKLGGMCAAGAASDHGGQQLFM